MKTTLLKVTLHLFTVFLLGMATKANAQENTAPSFTSTPPVNVNIGEEYRYTATTAGDVVSITSADKPSWITLTTGFPVSTFAGDLYGDADGTGTAAQFRSPYGVAVDSAGNVYVADRSSHRIRKITPAGVVSTFAGSFEGFADGTGTAAQFNSPRGVAVDSAGNVYVADYYNHSIRKITPAGEVTTFAGSGESGFVDGTGTAAQFDSPQDVAVDSAGNVYVADRYNHKIRKITPAGVVSTLAGSTQGFADGIGETAKFSHPQGVAVDNEDNVYVADTGNVRIRKITPAGVVTTFAGSGGRGSVDGTGTAAKFRYPVSVAVDSASNVYVSDEGAYKIRKITTNNNGDVMVSTLAGSSDGFADGAGAAAQFSEEIHGVAVDSEGNIYVADNDNSRIRKIEQAIAGSFTGDTTGYLGTHTFTVTLTGADGTIVEQEVTINVAEPLQLAEAEVKEDINGNDNGVNVTAMQLNLITGVFGAIDGVDYTAALIAAKNASPSGFADADNPTAVEIQAVIDAVNTKPNFTATPSNANVNVGEIYSYTATTIGDVVSMTTTDIPSWLTLTLTTQYPVLTLAGSREEGLTDGRGTAAKFDSPFGIAVDRAGNVYVADRRNNKIRKITPTGVVSTFAGSTRGAADGTGTAAQFNDPRGVAVDSAGNVYVADNGNHSIRKITPAGAVSTLAGGFQGFADGTGTAAQFNSPRGVAVDSSGNVYVADTSNHSIRKITPAGAVSTLAGNGEYGSADGTGAAAKFNNPYGVAVDNAGNVYVADNSNHKIRKITPAGEVSTLAGSGEDGDVDGTGTAAQFEYPAGIAVDNAGNVYVADTDNHKIRKITPTGEVSTLAGSGGEGFVDGTGRASQFDEPRDIAVDSEGNLYVADTDNNSIRKITKTIAGSFTGDTTDHLGLYTFTITITGNNGATTTQQVIIKVVDPAQVEAALVEVKEDIAGNTNEVNVTAEQLNVLNHVFGAIADVNYTDALQAASYDDRTNPTAAEIQAVIDAVNAEVAAALAEVVEDIKGNVNGVKVTAAQLNSIGGISGAQDGVDYTTALDNGTYADQDNPTAAEIQAVIDAANAEVAALAEVVEDIKGNTNGIKVTAAQLNSIGGVSGAIDGVDYTEALKNGTYADEDNPTAAEIQAVIDAANAEVAALAEVVEDIKGNTNGIKVTAAQLNSIGGVSGAIDGVDYTEALKNGTYADEDNPTVAEIQAVIDAANTPTSRAKKYGFSPNGDGINDTWTIDYITQYPNNTVKVFNRSGKLVFEQNGYDNTWNGISNQINTSVKLPVGAYLFVIDLKSGEKLIKGWVYLNY